MVALALMAASGCLGESQDRVARTAATQPRACDPQPPFSAGGSEESTDGGVTWSACQGFTCLAGYQLAGGACVATSQTRACQAQPQHSAGGTERSSDAGATWGACEGFTCLAGYQLAGGSCVATSQTRACQAQPQHSAGGTESSSDGGVTWGTCQGFTCLEHYQLSGGACAPVSYTLTLTAPVHGTVSGAASGATYPYGSTVTLTASPAATYKVMAWTGAPSCGSASSCQVVMDADRAVGVQIAKAPVGFGADVTGGAGGAVVTATTGAELEAALCDSVVSGHCTDTTPRIVQLTSIIDFRGTEGTATSPGCVYASNGCTLNGRTEQVLNVGTFCSGRTVYPITYDAAGTRPMLVGSNKTVVGVGRNAGWKGKGLRLAGGHANVIVRNLSITDVNEGIIWAGDGITLDGVSRVWIDHNYLARFGRMMIVSGWGTAAGVTISNNVFDGTTFCGQYCDGRHFWNVLLAGDGQSITFAANAIRNTSGDAPELGKGAAATSGGVVHVVNNSYEGSYHAGVVTSDDVVALVEGNHFAPATYLFPIYQSSTNLVFAPLESAVASANPTCRAVLGRDCSGNRATNSVDGFIMNPAVMPTIQGAPAWAGALGAVVPLGAGSVPGSVGASAGPQADPDG